MNSCANSCDDKTFENSDTNSCEIPTKVGDGDEVSPGGKQSDSWKNVNDQSATASSDICKDLSSCEECISSTECKWTTGFLFLTKSSCLPLEAGESQQLECSASGMDFSDRRQQLYVFLFVVFAIFCACYYRCKRSTPLTPGGKKGGKGGDFAPIPKQEKDVSGLIENDAALDNDSDLEAGWAAWDDDEEEKIKPKSIQMSSMRANNNKKNTFGKASPRRRSNSKGSKSMKPKISSAESSGLQSSNEKVRLKLNMAGKKSKKNIVTKKKRKNERRNSKGRKSLDVKAKSSSRSNTPVANDDLFSSLGMSASPKFDKKPSSPQMDMLVPSRAANSPRALEPEILDINMDVTDASRNLFGNDGDGSNTSKDTKLAATESTDSKSQNPFDDDDDGWGDSSDDAF